MMRRRTLETVIAARPERVLERIAAAADALYVVAREGLYAKLLRLPAGGGTLEEIALPHQGLGEPALGRPAAPGCRRRRGKLDDAADLLSVRAGRAARSSLCRPARGPPSMWGAMPSTT